MQFDWRVFLDLLLSCLLPVAVSIGFYFLEYRTKFKKLPYMARQAIIGIAFGLVAIFGTEFGVDVGGAAANVRDSGPLCAGLIFGGPAGIIAGVIGGVERFVSTYWRGTTFTQWACSLSTIFAGLYAFFLRKFIFENERPNWAFGFLTGIIMEVFHMVMVFITRLQHLDTAFNVIKIVSIPMILANGLAMLLSCLFIQLLERKRVKKKSYHRLANKIQGWLLLTVFAGYIITTSFMFVLETNLAKNDAQKLLETNIQDVVKDVENSTSNDLLSKTKSIQAEINSKIDQIDSILIDLKIKYQVNEINYIELIDVPNEGKFPIITHSTDHTFVVEKFRMVGPQAEPFNVLLKSSGSGITEFVQEVQRRDADASLMKYAGVSQTNPLLPNDAYVQVGYTYSQFEKVVKERVAIMSTFRHAGTDGIIVVADKDLKVCSVMEKYDEVTLTDIGIKITDEDQGKMKSKNLYLGDVDSKGNPKATKCAYMYSEAEGFYIVVLIPEESVYMSRDNVLYILSFMEVLVFASLFLTIYLLLNKMFVKNVDKINESLHNIAAGNLDDKVKITGSYEFDNLSKDINTTVEALKHYIHEASSRIDEELAFAKSIQSSALPSVYPAFPNRPSIDIFAKMFTAKEVGGDFYDYYMLDNDHLGFLIADVSGKGIPAAMFMMESKAMLKNQATTLANVEEILENTNVELCKNNKANMFVTCWFGVLNIQNGHLYFSSAGHNPAVKYSKKTNKWEYVKAKPGFVLGGIDFAKFSREYMELEPGDKIFLYTDGVTEATRGDNVLYGEDRLLDYLNSHTESEITSYLENLKHDIDTFIDGASQFDDITMLMIEYKGADKK